MNLRIHITIEDKNGHTEVHPVDVNVEMPEVLALTGFVITSTNFRVIRYTTDERKT